MTHTDIASGERGRRFEVHNRFANSGTEIVPEYRHFFNPQWAIKSLIEGIVHYKLGFQLENPDGFFHTTVVFSRGAGFIIFVTAGANGPGFGLMAAPGVIRTLLYGASILNGKERTGRSARAVAIHLPHTHSHRREEECGNPKPGERFCYAGRHISPEK